MADVKKLLLDHPDFLMAFAVWIFPAIYHVVVMKILKAEKGTFWGRVDEILRSMGFDPTILEKREGDVDKAAKELAEDLIKKGKP
jgi:hypothetical protein